MRHWKYVALVLCLSFIGFVASPALAQIKMNYSVSSLVRLHNNASTCYRGGRRLRREQSEEFRNHGVSRWYIDPC